MLRGDKAFDITLRDIVLSSWRQILYDYFFWLDLIEKTFLALINVTRIIKIKVQSKHYVQCRCVVRMTTRITILWFLVESTTSWLSTWRIKNETISFTVPTIILLEIKIQITILNLNNSDLWDICNPSLMSTAPKAASHSPLFP